MLEDEEVTEKAFVKAVAVSTKPPAVHIRVQFTLATMAVTNFGNVLTIIKYGRVEYAYHNLLL